jgi:hypothetical protein
MDLPKETVQTIFNTRINHYVQKLKKPKCENAYVNIV